LKYGGTDEVYMTAGFWVFQLPIGRVTGHVVFAGFHLSGNGVYQDLGHTVFPFIDSASDAT
jgi:hypothetical protein